MKAINCGGVNLWAVIPVGRAVRTGVDDVALSTHAIGAITMAHVKTLHCPSGLNRESIDLGVNLGELIEQQSAARTGDSPHL